jgi:hypothetical protein
MRGTSVSEIHRYPLRPIGFEEPLFPTRAFRRMVAEHLARSPWLSKASELVGSVAGGGEAARCRQEPVHVLRGRNGQAYLVRRCRWGRVRKRRVVRVLERWRDIGRWWDGEAYVNRLVFRVLLQGSPEAVVDLALEVDSGEWLLVGVVD